MKNQQKNAILQLFRLGYGYAAYAVGYAAYAVGYTAYMLLDMQHMCVSVRIRLAQPS